jgi:DNA-binding response OmpR family regulator/HPt (histidine-containing phosphotransfer) domain-containing protein
MKILLIEDDDALINLLTRSLSAHHHVVDAVKDGEMGWTYASTFDYNLIILDIMLPKLDGISLCTKLRNEGYTMPILLLTAQDQTTAKVQGLDAGADDYVVKPFDIAELIARVRALLRRGSSNVSPLLSWGDLVLNSSNCDVTYNGQLLNLTTKEYDLLELLLRDSSHVFSSDEIIDRLWSSDDFPAEATVRSHLRRLRNKLQAAGAPSDLIGTIHGRGYGLKSSPASLKQVATDDINLLNQKSGSIVFNTSMNTNVVEPSQQQELQYLIFLQETWLTTKPQCLENMTELAAIFDRLIAGNSNYPEQQQAHQQAHKLVGTLGIFYLLSAMEIARKIELVLKPSTLLNPAEAAALPALLAELIAEVTVGNPVNPGLDDPCQQSYTSSPVPAPLSKLLLIDVDPALNLAITAMANQQDCQTIKLVSNWVAIDSEVGILPETVESYLLNISADSVLLPTVVLLGCAASTQPQHQNNCLDLIDHLHQRFPHWSILVLSNSPLNNSDELNERLAVVQKGGKFLSINHLTNEQIFSAATSLWRSATEPIKVMVVDDDVHWLRSLPQLLQPWEMKVTTLADPPQFWTVLELVQPDVLILDIYLPGINGLELCQILRGDPHWQHLPVLFLTAAQEPSTQQQAFQVGGDDYLCKPLMAETLAHRIRHRWRRSQAEQILISR